MPTYQFFQLDVFADTPLAGNPLAVFPEAGGLDPETMQRIAREMNLSETTFVTKSDRATKRVRFFTPTSELPLAGHPTVGTWWSLCEQGLINIPPGGIEITQETGAGVLPVRISGKGSEPTQVTMTQAIPEFFATVTKRDELAGALGAQVVDLAADPPEVVSTAIPQMMIRISNRKALRELPVGGMGSSLATLLRSYDTDCAMCFFLEGNTAYCRMFAPGLGVPEDPATGSAAGALGAYLTYHALLEERKGTNEIVVLQGAEIDRPSRILVAADWDGSRVTSVRVGGTAVTVISGQLTI
jgi:trans-2,3-dihydro-3-hydroxyanthranilate isomerase